MPALDTDYAAPAKPDLGPDTDYSSVIATCSIRPPAGDYSTSDIRWSSLEKSLCVFPPGSQDLSPGSVTPYPVNSDYSTVYLSPLAEITGRSIERDDVQAWTPYSNTTLTFQVETGKSIYNPETGNYEPEVIAMTYLAYLSVMPPTVNYNPGVDVTAYLVEGRLLEPNVFDPRIQNGAQAEGTFNEYKGRFVYKVNLDTPPFYFKNSVNQPIQGIFHVIGGGGGGI